MSDISACQTHAILIGINWYDNPHVRPLEGCVRDINNVESLLRKHRPGLHISKITAAQPNEAMPPTYENVSNMMNEIKSQIRPNDFVYFHYSGHGGRQLRNSSHGHPLQNSNGGNYYEYLLLHGNRHLKNYELGDHLIDFTRAGANVFAVLDCCHSGGGDRGDVTGIRQVIHDLPHMLEEERYHYEDEEASTTPGNRNAFVGDTYWTKARKYTILAACQRYQFARELPNIYNQIEGALTSTMVQSLEGLLQNNTPPTYKILFDTICARININKGPSRRQDERHFVPGITRFSSWNMIIVCSKQQIGCRMLLWICILLTQLVEDVRHVVAWILRPCMMCPQKIDSSQNLGRWRTKPVFPLNVTIAVQFSVAVSHTLSVRPNQIANYDITYTDIVYAA